MLKLLYTLLTNPLGLPIEPLWEYLILLVVNEICHAIAWRQSSGGTFGSLIYWSTKALTFVAIWAALYIAITVIKFVIVHWAWFAVGGTVTLIVGAFFYPFARFTREESNDDS